MDDADLKALLQTGNVPARDPAFELAVLARIERRRFRRALAMNIALAASGALLLALLMPTLQIIWQDNFAAMVSDWMLAAMLFAMTLLLQRWIVQRN